MLSVLLSTAMAGPGWALILPFGVGAFTEGKPGRGVVYASTQTVGFGLVVAGTVLADQAAEADDADASLKWRYVALGGASFGLGSLFVSILDASRLHQLHSAEASDRARLYLSYPHPLVVDAPQLPPPSICFEHPLSGNPALMVCG